MKLQFEHILLIFFLLLVLYYFSRCNSVCGIDGFSVGGKQNKFKRLKQKLKRLEQELKRLKKLKKEQKEIQKLENQILQLRNEINEPPEKTPCSDSTCDGQYRCWNRVAGVCALGVTKEYCNDYHKDLEWCDSGPPESPCPAPTPCPACPPQPFNTCLSVSGTDGHKLDGKYFFVEYDIINNIFKFAMEYNLNGESVNAVITRGGMDYMVDWYLRTDPFTYPFYRKENDNNLNDFTYRWYQYKGHQTKVFMDPQLSVTLIDC